MRVGRRLVGAVEIRKLTQCIILPSRAPDMKLEPSGSHANAVTVSVCSVRVSKHTPVCT